MSQNARRRALISVSDKTDVGPFALALAELGFEIVSTGGTRRFLEEQGLEVIDVSAYTGFPEIMAGRVKTLHPKVHGAILGRPDESDDAEAIREHGIVPFELVVCNLYPFEETIAGKDTTLAEAIEQIDIGGPSMIRAAAKNHAYVGVVTRPEQYREVLDALKAGSLEEGFRRRLAAAAFEMTAHYDRAIADYMSTVVKASGGVEPTAGAVVHPFPLVLNFDFHRRMELRYGENFHQRAAFYTEPEARGTTLADTEQRHGKELSYNNLLDLDAALETVREFDTPAAVVIKHNNPCGCGFASSLSEAFEKAYSGDPVSAYGSIIGFNRKVDLPTAEKLCQPNRFVEAIIAPDYEDEAFEALTTRPTWKKNVRLMQCPGLGAGSGANVKESSSVGTAAPSGYPSGSGSGWDYRRVRGGLLVQDRDDGPEVESEWRVVTEISPTPAQREDLLFAWLVAKHVKSNAIVFAKEGAVVGVGAGQMSRLDSVFLAAHKASDRSRDGAMASDAFFPFRDGIDQAAQAGIKAVIQPGGSKRDEDVIAACNEHGIAMIFTGRRHFRH